MQSPENEQIKKAPNRRAWYVIAVLVLALVAGAAVFIVFTLPKSDTMLHPQAAVVHIGCENDEFVFNVTASAPPVASNFHAISLQAAVCNISSFLLTYTGYDWVHLARISVDGPVQLIGEGSSNQTLRGDVNVTSADLSRFLSWQDAFLRLKVNCSIQIKAHLYWGIYQAVQYKNVQTFFRYDISEIARRATGSGSFASFLHLGFKLFLSDLQDVQSTFVFPKDKTALVLRPKLPLVVDTSGLISAIYLNIPEISFDIGVHTFRRFGSAYQESNFDPTQGVVRVGTYPTQWQMLKYVKNGTVGTIELSRTRGNFFITCAQGYCSNSSIRPIIMAFTNYLTTHPVSGIAFSFLTSDSSSVLFRKLLGRQNSIIVRFYQGQASRRKMYPRSGVVENQNQKCFEADFIETWKLLVCSSTVHNFIAEGEIPNFQYLLDPHYLPSLELTFAEMQYFVSLQGNPLLNALANVVQLRKMSLAKANSLLGIAQAQSNFLDDSLSMLGDLNMEAVGFALVQRQLEIDIGAAKNAGTGSQDGSSILFAALRLLDAQGAMELEWVNKAARWQLNDLNELISWPIKWSICSKMQTNYQELYVLEAALEASQDKIDLDRIEGLVSTSLTSGGFPILDGAIQGNLIVRHNQISGNLVAIDRRANVEDVSIHILVGADQPDGNWGFEDLVLLADVQLKNEMLLHTKLGFNLVWPDTSSIGIRGTVNFGFNSATLLNWEISAGVSWPENQFFDGAFKALLNVHDNGKQLISFDANLISEIINKLLSTNGSVSLTFQDTKLLGLKGSVAGKYSTTEVYSSPTSSGP
eukprot:754244-Hanusia_phi.AAC.1